MCAVNKPDRAARSFEWTGTTRDRARHEQTQPWQ